MHPLIDIESIQRRAVLITFEDGLLDCALGLSLASIALAITLERIIPLEDWWIAILSLPLFALFIVGKRLITWPRIGRVEFRNPKKRSLRRLLLFLSLLTGLALAVTGAILSFFPPDWIRGGTYLFPLLWFVFFTLGFAVLGYATDVIRFHSYGLIMAISLPAQQVLRYSGFSWQFCLIPFLAGAVILTGAGCFLLVRFLRRYPVPEQGPNHA